MKGGKNGNIRPKDMKSKFGPVVKYVVFAVFVYAVVATLKIACDQVPKPPTPPVM